MPSGKHLYPALAAVDTLLAATGRDRGRRFTKPLLMPALMVDRPRPIQRALALGGVGDVALLGGGGRAFTARLGAFLAGHVAWLMAVRPEASGGLRRRPLVGASYVAAWAGLNA